MPLAHVYVWKGFSDQAKKKTIAGITKVFEELGIPPHAVEVIIHEIPKDDWGIGGEQACERFKDMQPP